METRSRSSDQFSKAMVGSGVCLVLVEFNQEMGESSLVAPESQHQMVRILGFCQFFYVFFVSDDEWKVKTDHNLKDDQITCDIGLSCQGRRNLQTW